MAEMLTKRYSDDQLHKILDEAMIYMCACPAQVAREILNLRELYAYQQNCLASKDDPMTGVHGRIAGATAAAHADMERCLEDVLRMEGWNLQTLAMPPGLRQRRDELIDKS